MKKLKVSNGNEDNSMVAYKEEAFKNKFEEIIKGNNLMVKMAKYGRKGTLPLLVALPLLSLASFCQGMLENLIPTLSMVSYGYPDMNQDGQGDKKLQGSVIRARAENEREWPRTDDCNERNYEGLQLKNEGIEDDGKPFKLHMNHIISKEYSMEQFRVEKVQEDVIMSTDAQLPNPHNERTSESSHSNLDLMRIIMQELKLIKREIRDMQRDISNLSIEQGSESHIEGHVNSHTQRGDGNYNHHGSFEIPIQSTHRFYDSGRHTTPRDGRR
ncbi:hypothetical protein M9H77_12998 [Catharanthus roseus]|uniref:Uncharacterized protein n=1 Tax=Catharanthus roseus TaxID=4058 RepID=A0ACC0BIY2_CATRO|nr:hypothetical protein M9H77_12998 [Catharanthus roseus]